MKKTFFHLSLQDVSDPTKLLAQFSLLINDLTHLLNNLVFVFLFLVIMMVAMVMQVVMTMDLEMVLLRRVVLFGINNSLGPIPGDYLTLKIVQNWLENFSQKGWLGQNVILDS